MHKNKTGIFVLIASFLFAFLTSGSAFAQVTTGSILGTVRDTTGAVVPNATITITDTGKGTTWEGGIREPAFAYWKGRITPNTESSEIISTMDILPTFARLANASLPDNVTIDGRDFSEIMFNPATAKSSWDYLWHWRTRADSPINVTAVRFGPYKAHFATQSGYETDPPVVHNPPLLFNVDQDPSEQYPLLASDYTELLQTLVAEFHSFMGSITISGSLTQQFNSSYAVCIHPEDPSKCYYQNATRTETFGTNRILID